MSETKATFVFVPGAWHGPETWDQVISVLKEQGYKSVAVALPTTSGDPTNNFVDDVRAVKEAITAETSRGRNVVLVVHSYGGAVGASALKGLTETQNGPSGHVIGYFMIATGFMERNMTFLSGSGGKPPPFWAINSETGLADLLVDTRELFYHDLPEDEGKKWVGRLLPQSTRAFTEGAEAAWDGWKELPVWFLATVEDKALPIEVQKMFVQTAIDAGGDVTLREIMTSHSPMLSKPEETASVILEALTEFSK